MVMNKEQINTSPEYQYLQFVELKDFLLWDVKKYTKKFVSYSNKEFVYLQDHIEERSQKIKLSNYPKDDFGILGVNNEIGIFDAYIAKGSKINQPYKTLETDWLSYNPYRINVGSIGLKTKNHIGKYISPAYVVFSCKNSLLPEFLFKLFKTNNFNDLIKENTSGSVRQILSFTALKNIQIPLPSLQKQQEIVSSYNQKTIEAEVKEQKANQLEKSIDEYLIKELGIELPQGETKQDHFLKFVEFKDLSRWDSSFVIPTKTVFKSSYNPANLKELIVSFLKDESGKSLKINTSKQHPNDKIYYIGMDNVEKNTGNTFIREMLGINIKSQAVKVPKGFFIYGKLRPYLNKYWFNDNDDRDIVCSSEFFVFKIKENINQLYFKYFISSSAVQSQINHHYTGARMPRISPEIFQRIKIPLPPLPIQNQIADKISSVKQETKTLRNEAERLRAQAKEEFENEVFSKKLCN